MTTTTARLKHLNPLSAIDLDDVRKPAMFVVGAADLAVEQVKDAGTDLSAKASARARQLSATVPSTVQELRTALSGRATTAQDKATSAYGSIASRGEKLVGSLRGSKPAPTTTRAKKAPGKTT